MPRVFSYGLIAILIIVIYKGRFHKKMRKSLVIHQTRGGGVTPNQTLFLKKKKSFFSGTILGHPKYVLHLVSSINFIAKALNVM